MRDFTPEIERFLRRNHYERITPAVALIDMDGTLYDSMPSHTAAWHRMATEAGIPSIRDEFFAYEGMTGAATIDLLIRRTFNRPATDEEKRELYARKSQYFREMPEVAPMKGAQRLLGEMEEIGMGRVLVTGSGQKSLIERLQRDFPGSFSPELMVTSANVSHGKPHPEPYIKGLQMAGIGPRKAIAIENAPLGVKSADTAGIFTVGLTTGPIAPEKLSEAGAAIVFSSMEEFANNFATLIFQLFNTSVDKNVIL